ncbi:ParB/RepB/Spo0J family partition protein [Kosakonia radicincitans]|uniref:ParB/RepB/Spo0J family partition protein n=1 Tax=Kosakonia radicincitans TaxID=283686 RepID=UPI002367A2CB|nr:ParB/RepB/Spo0J family partition protein [Kosakonia radicincitans]MDD7997461.1 ParB/RepB/Spo0J family partition protein [Kosakonia radicincitans]
MVSTNTTAKPATKSTRKKVSADVLAAEEALRLAPVGYAPFSRFVESEFNARIIKHTDEEIAAYAASIKALGILHNLIVVENDDGTLGVVCGNGRRRGTGLLVEQGVIGAGEPFIPYKIIPKELARAASLAEDSHKAMHPAEQIIGFRAMAAEGNTPAQIGDLFGFSPRHVQRILSLANLAPELLEELTHDCITLELCQVMTLEHDQTRQLEIWNKARETFGSGMPYVSWLKSQISNIKISMDSALFRFVGEEAYLAAGGITDRDLFSDAGEGFADRLLTERLLLEKLAAEAERLKQEEGWAWCDSRMDELREDAEWRLPEPELTAEEEAAIQKLLDQIEVCETEDDENSLQQQIEDTEEAAMMRMFTPEFKAAHGVVVSYECGSYNVQRGVKHMDATEDSGTGTGDAGTESRLPETTGKTLAYTSTRSRIEADKYSEKLVKAMSSERTLAVQAELAGKPDIAVALLVWTLCREVFGARHNHLVKLPLDITLRQQWALHTDAPSGEKGQGYTTLRNMKRDLKAGLPPEWEQDFTWLLTWPVDRLHALLGFCIATGISGQQGREMGYTQASKLDNLEAAMGFDLRDWWQPGAENYFSRISKDQIGDALADAGCEDRAREALKLKKADAALLAEKTVAETRWIPGWMKRPEPEEQQDTAEASNITHTDHAA